MPLQLFKYAKRGPDKLIGGLTSSGSGHGSIHNNDMQTMVSLSFGDADEKRGKFILLGTADEMKKIVATVAQSAVSFEGTQQERYHPKRMVPYAVAWLRSIADEMEGKA